MSVCVHINSSLSGQSPKLLWEVFPGQIGFRSSYIFVLRVFASIATNLGEGCFVGGATPQGLNPALLNCPLILPLVYAARI
ncbi:uncharacterized protein LAJ45_08595 [Morchella importuna]|uniref:uncharacterized protein n=1 Tax=Morchella importuna TaxID=1174673 RepID=UPI001E8CC90B|nr:uncharacterized protein LAJ45_08595 [Morchella importuna]KAH8147439.1 hypothetical protein LAJ45_08595 [Morchella importuna]